MTDFIKLEKQLIIPPKEKRLIFLNEITDTEILLSEKSELLLVGLLTKGFENKRNFSIRAIGERARARALVFVLGKDSETFNFDFSGVHEANHTTISMRIRAALSGSAVCEVGGLAKVEEKVIDADSYFAHHTLILSEQARAKASPNLEIKSDSVKAGHSASVGKVDEDAMFYLLSRGLDKTSARALLIAGFFETEMQDVPDDSIKEKIRLEVNNFLF